MKPSILIVDDEEEMLSMLTLILEEEFSVTPVSDGVEAVKLLQNRVFDLCILDIMMPRLDGMEVLHVLNREQNRIPVILLSARADTRDRVAGLEGGADDYITKPFEPAELVARVKSLLRRAGSGPGMGGAEPMPGIRIDHTGRTAFAGEKELRLTRTEFDLLATLAGSPGRAWSREELVERIWGWDFPGEVRTVDTHVKNLREKLKQAGASPDLIDTVWGYGYKWRSL